LIAESNYCPVGKMLEKYRQIGSRFDQKISTDTLIMFSFYFRFFRQNLYIIKQQISSRNLMADWLQKPSIICATQLDGKLAEI